MKIRTGKECKNAHVSQFEMNREEQIEKVEQLTTEIEDRSVLNHGQSLNLAEELHELGYRLFPPQEQKVELNGMETIQFRRY